MDKISQSKNELEKIKILLDRKSKEIEIIKQISNQINKSLDLNLIASSMLSLKFATPIALAHLEYLSGAAGIENSVTVGNSIALDRP